MKHIISPLDSRSRKSYGPNFDTTAYLGSGSERPYDTLNPFKEARREAVHHEVNNRISFAGGYHNLPTDFRVSAFDLFNKLQEEVKHETDPIPEGWGIWRLGFRETYRKVLAHIKLYRVKAIKQYKAGYRERPAFFREVRCRCELARSCGKSMMCFRCEGPIG
jgi:hypothetical protein